MKWHIDPSKLVIHNKLVRKCTYHENGQLWCERYYLNNKRHNPNGPSYSVWYDNGQLSHVEYYLNNRRHNLNGPAILSWYYFNGELSCAKYFLNGQRLSEQEHARLTQ